MANKFERRKVIRFAVGNKGNQLSPVFKIWNRKNDVYLTGTFTHGAIKISMHSSGVWPVAATIESGIKFGSANRRMKAWNKPCEYKKGITRGPHIAVFRIPEFDNVHFDELQDRQIEWIPSPNKNCKVTIVITFLDQDVNISNLQNLCGITSGYLNTYLELENKQKVLMITTNENCDKNEDKRITDFFQSESFKITNINKKPIAGIFVLFMQAGEVPYLGVSKFGSLM